MTVLVQKLPEQWDNTEERVSACHRSFALTDCPQRKAARGKRERLWPPPTKSGSHEVATDGQPWQTLFHPQM